LSGKYWSSVRSEEKTQTPNAKLNVQWTLDFIRTKYYYELQSVSLEMVGGCPHGPGSSRIEPG